MRSVGLTLTFALALLAGMLAFWPMRAALGATGAERLGLSAVAVTGTLWRGRLDDARLGPVPLGDVRARTSLLALLAGRTELSLEGETGPFRADLAAGRGEMTARQVDLRAPLSVLGLPAAADGGLALSRAGVSFRDGQCQAASGRLIVEGLAGPGWRAPPLDGPLSCDGREVLARLEGRDDRVALDAELRMDGGGGWRLAVTARPDDPLVAAALLAQGFAEGPEGLTLDARGRLR